MQEICFLHSPVPFEYTGDSKRGLAGQGGGLSSLLRFFVLYRTRTSLYWYRFYVILIRR